MALAIGVDIIEIERVRAVVDRHGCRFLNRVYTPRELAHCNGRAPSLAARFAAKEAIAKALGTGIGTIGWHDVEVLSDARGKPVACLHGRAQQLFDDLAATELAVSLSHSRGFAVAMAVAQ